MSASESSDATRSGRERNARVYQDLRTAHLERAHTHTPATIFYVRRSYDFDERTAQGLALVKAGTVGVVLRILRSRFDQLEVNEPLARLRLLRTALAIGAARLTAAARKGRLQVVAHAIENRDPFGATEPNPSWKQRLRARLELALTVWLAQSLDRLSYGTPAAQELYERKLGPHLKSAETALFTELPSPCECLGEPIDRPMQVTFVGAFDERKGVRALLAAWPSVQLIEPGLRLLLLGKGPLTGEVQEASAAWNSVEVVVDPSRERVHAALRASRVLVLLSQPRARWREQVGLPIVEGLAHDCSVVTTDQTGLAAWLESHGHAIVAPHASLEDTARAIVEAAHRWEPSVTVAALPEVDGRTRADRWLFRVEEHS